MSYLKTFLKHQTKLTIDIIIKKKKYWYLIRFLLLLISGEKNNDWYLLRTQPFLFLESQTQDICSLCETFVKFFCCWICCYCWISSFELLMILINYPFFLSIQVWLGQCETFVKFLCNIICCWICCHCWISSFRLLMILINSFFPSRYDLVNSEIRKHDSEHLVGSSQ